VSLNLSELEFIDSTGLHALIQAIDDANDNGCRLRIEQEVAPPVLRVLEVMHLEHLIPGFESDGGPVAHTDRA
jgi:anti-anti-sigma factor